MKRVQIHAAGISGRTREQEKGNLQRLSSEIEESEEGDYYKINGTKRISRKLTIWQQRRGTLGRRWKINVRKSGKWGNRTKVEEEGTDHKMRGGVTP